MKKVKLYLTLASTLLMAACSGIGLFVVNFPTYFKHDKMIRNVSFGPDSWQKLDIYQPPRTVTPSGDVIVFYYGGRWETGSRSDYTFVGSTLARLGYVVIIPDYRKYPQVKFPVFVQDAAKALAWVYEHAAAYGGHKGRIHIAGHSAGAHIAALLAVDDRYLKTEGLTRSQVIRDFVGISGPYSFTPEDRDLVDMFGPPDRYPQMQATTFIDGTQPPMLLLWGADDKDVGQFNMNRLAAAVKAKGGCVETKIYPATDHVDTVAALSWVGSGKITVAQDMTEFFKKGCLN